MEKHSNPFDEFLKETLKGHQIAPPEKAKKAFLKEASTIITTRKGWLNWYYLPILVVLISGIVAVFYFRNGNEAVPGETITTGNIITGPNPRPDTVSNYNINYNSTSTPVLNNATSSTSIQIHASLKEAETQTILMTSETAKSTYVEPHGTSADLSVNNVSDTRPDDPVSAVKDDTGAAALSAQSISVKNETLPSETTSYRLALDSLAETAVQNTDIVAANLVDNSDTSAAIPPPVNTEPGKPVREKPVNYFAAGAYYMPEWIFNTFDGNKFINGFGVEGTCYLGPFSIRTGVGISISNDITELAVEYNDYLGSYNKLDSMSFIYNEPAHNFIPNYYMSSEKVWDTLPQLEYQEMKMKYTYVRIPLVFGYDFWQKGSFSLGIRIGTAVSLLLNSKQLTEDYNPGENRVVNMYKITPDYVSVNWQMTGGLNASARLAKNAWFEFEPVAKYFYKSIYENPGSTKVPFSVGIRCAVIFKF